MTEWSSGGLLTHIHSIPDSTALHQDDRMMTVPAEWRRRETNHESGFQFLHDSLERERGEVVTLVNDYLERRLGALNRLRVADKTPWLLVQPSGVFPLVGPLFSPPGSACWTCLFDRMIRNREIKGFLEREASRPALVSPLVRKGLGQSAIHFAAVETAKAVASGFRTDLGDHIASFDLLGATVAKHYVAKRPQCPTCGNKKLQNPRRAPKPVELGPGAVLAALLKRTRKDIEVISASDVGSIRACADRLRSAS